MLTNLREGLTCFPRFSGAECKEVIGRHRNSNKLDIGCSGVMWVFKTRTLGTTRVGVFE